MTHTVPRYSPYSVWLAVADIDKSVECYSKCFGYEFVCSYDGDDGIAGYAELEYHGMTLLLSLIGTYAEPVVTPKDGNYWPPITIYSRVDDVEATYEKCIQEGLHIVRPPEVTPWGHKLIEVLDYERYSWMLYKEIE